MSSRALQARNHLGVVRRHHPDDLQAVEDARRDLAIAKIHDYIERVVADAPPLTDAQRERLAAILRGGAS